MSRSDVLDLMGEPDLSFNRELEKQDLYYEGMLQVFYNVETEKIHFIEVHYDMVLKHGISLDGINVFTTPRRELLIKIEDKYSSSVDLHNDEYPNTCLFKKLQVSLWTGDLTFDFFKTIGVGVSGYFK